MLALIAVCACQQPAASGEPSAPTGPVVRTDTALLAQRIQLPDGIQSARWSVVPLGTTGGAAPGPTDTRLYAFLQPDVAATANLAPLPTNQTQTSASVPADIARSLIPADTLATLHADAAGGLVLTGERYDPGAFNRGAYQGVFAVHVRDGVLVCMQTL